MITYPYEIHITIDNTSTSLEELKDHFEFRYVEPLSIDLLNHEGKIIGNHLMVTSKLKSATYADAVENALNLTQELSFHNHDILRVKIETHSNNSWVGYGIRYFEAHIMIPFPNDHVAVDTRFATWERIKEFINISKYKWLLSFNPHKNKFYVTIRDTNFNTVSQGIREFQNLYKGDKNYKIEAEACLADTNTQLDKDWINETHPSSISCTNS